MLPLLLDLIAHNFSVVAGPTTARASSVRQANPVQSKGAHQTKLNQTPASFRFSSLQPSFLAPTPSGRLAQNPTKPQATPSG